MTKLPYRSALIVGAGSGISASVARALTDAGVMVGMAARNIDKLQPMVSAVGVETFQVEASDPASVAALFKEVDAAIGEPEIVLYNASAWVRGPLVDIDRAAVERTLAVTAFGAFLVAQQAARRMEPKGSGAILFTGSTAGVKGFARSAPFAMGKFALRGLAQATARELAPKGIHVAHFVIDGMVGRAGQSDGIDSRLDPDAIAQTYLGVLAQPRSAWTAEVEMRPWIENY